MGLLEKLKGWAESLIPHSHNWETRATNYWYLPTYQVCYKCGKARERINKPFEPEEWQECERLFEFDPEYDEDE